MFKLVRSFITKAKIANPKIPWCSVCEDHTVYHLKEASSGKTRAMYTCNECGSDTWKPTSPVLFGAVVTAIIFGLRCRNDTVKLEGASGDLAFYNSSTGNKHLLVGISMEQRETLEKI